MALGAQNKQRRLPPSDGDTEISPKRDPKILFETPPNANGLIETMVEAAGRLEIDEKGHCEYHGDFAGLAFLHQIDERCSQLLEADLEKKEAFSHSPLRQAFGSKRFSLHGPRADFTSIFHLPSRATTQYLAKVALKDASCLMEFIYLPSFNKLLDWVYSVKSEDYSGVEKAFLPLLYITLAFGEPYVGGQQSQGAAASRVD